jgi:hypothetical protein
MNNSTPIAKRDTERESLLKMGVLLLNIYAVLGIAAIVYQGSHSPVPIPIVQAHSIVPSAYDVGRATARRHQGIAKLTVTSRGITFFARELSPSDVSNVDRKQWIEDFKAGYAGSQIHFAAAR